MGPRLMRRPPKYVNGFIDRHGRPRFYFRRPGFKAVPLPGLPWSPEFMAAYEGALTGLPAEIGASLGRTGPGTINALVVAYYKSDEWKHLSLDTTRTHRRMIERFREQHGDKRVALLNRGHVVNMLAAISGLSHKRHWLQAIRKLLAAAIPTLRSDNPTDGITIKLKKTKGHHTWTDDEIAQYRAHWPLGTQQRLVMEFALETTSRRGEVVRLGPQHIRNGHIRIERTHGSRDVDIPMTPELQAACDAMPKAHLTFIVTERGAPRSKNGLGNDFAKWATAAGLSKICRLHGLKKGGMRRLAEAQLTTHELMAISGHKTLAMVQHYTADADAKQLAKTGMAKLGGQRENTGFTNPASELTNRPLRR